MKTLRKELFSEPSKAINEDVATIHENAAWVIDGSSSLTGKRYTDGETDGAWYACQWDHYLRQYATESKCDLATLLAEGIREIRKLFTAFVDPNQIDPLDRPSCSLAVLRFTDTQCEYLVLGDCELVISPIGSEPVTVVDTRVSALDEIAIGRLADQQRRLQMSHREAFESVRPLLRENRRKKNTPGGYWIAEFDPQAAVHAVVGRWSLEQQSRFLLMTDGFAQYQRVFGLAASSAELVAHVQSKGLSATYASLKQAAVADPECSRFPRLKILDDAGAVFIEVAT